MQEPSVKPYDSNYVLISKTTLLANLMTSSLLAQSFCQKINLDVDTNYYRVFAAFGRCATEHIQAMSEENIIESINEMIALLNSDGGGIVHIDL